MVAALAIAASQSPPYMLCAYLFGVFLEFSVERSGTIDLFRRHEIFVHSCYFKSWAEILLGGHISGHLKILRFFSGNIFTHKK